MLFKRLNPSAALNIVSYADIDHFRESERYLNAVSMPLATGDFSVRRAELFLPSCSLSLVRTFPRIINGYELGKRLVLVIPMDNVTSARVNGEQIGRSLLVLSGDAQCTIYEPEGRLVAILSIGQAMQDGLSAGSDFHRGYRLIGLPSRELVSLRSQIVGMLELAAREPEACRVPAIRAGLQETLLESVERALRLGKPAGAGRHGTLDRYKTIVDGIDSMIRRTPTADLSCEQLAAEIGVSMRTIQTATQALCGSGAHHYSRLRRLWMVRRQLRSGAAGLTVKASAAAHGFYHMGEFSNLYRATFGELPSHTLATRPSQGG